MTKTGMVKARRIPHEFASSGALLFSLLGGRALSLNRAPLLSGEIVGANIRVKTGPNCCHKP